jgi:glycosyltransferase involved in cell wall biosynthesis
LEWLIVRDLPLALLAGIVGAIVKVSIVFDMAENYPAALLSYRNKWYRPLLFKNAWLPRAYERLALRLVDYVIVVAEEQKTRLLKQGYPEERILVIKNTPDCNYLSKMSKEELRDPAVKGRYILYSGFMDYHRGLRTLLLAFNEICARYPDLSLVLIGKGNESAELERLAQTLNIGHRVIFKGWLDFSLIPSYIRNSTVCVIPHIKSEHTDTTIPNKIFDYLYFSKPIIVSNAEPLKRMVREFRCGQVFKSGDYIDLSKALIRVLDNGHSSARPFSGRELIRAKYNWEQDIRKLLQLIVENSSMEKPLTIAQHVR